MESIIFAQHHHHLAMKTEAVGNYDFAREVLADDMPRSCRVGIQALLLVGSIVSGW